MTVYVKRGRHPGDPTGELLGEEHWPFPTYYDMEPDMYVAINRRDMQFIGVGEYRVLWNKAIEILPEEAIVIGPVESGTTYSPFTDMELKILWRNSTGEDHPEALYKDLLQACKKLGLALEPIPIPDCLMRKKARANVQGTVTGQTPTTPKQPTTPKPKAPVTRPKAGTATGKVWEIADSIFEKYRSEVEIGSMSSIDMKQLRAEIIQKCTEAGINPATAQVQFGKWKGAKEKEIGIDQE